MQKRKLEVWCAVRESLSIDAGRNQGMKKDKDKIKLAQRLPIDTKNADDNAKQAAGSSDESETQTARTLASLRQMLLRGDFRPGHRISELSLVACLGASRTPVRLAM